MKKLVECEVCGCLLYKDSAVRGESIVKWKWVIGFWSDKRIEYIHTPYYCYSHIPTTPKRRGRYATR